MAQTTQRALSPARAAALAAGRSAALSAGQASTARSVAQMLRKYRNAEPWTYYDTQILSGGAGAVNFANVPSPLPFMSARTTGNVGLAVTNMTDVGKMDKDFLATTISVDVHCDTDTAAPAGGGVATAPAFVETVVAYGVLAISFGQDVKYVTPVIKCPSGGGVVAQTKVRTQAAGTDTESGSATNGLQTSQARRVLDEPILFRRGIAFTLAILFPAGALARINALEPLAGDFEALIRVNLEGVAGKPLLEGTPTGAARRRRR